ncbi:MAG: hypothetical protein ACQKBU_07105 [Verrucomicrobiales bacterium]
MTELSKLPPQDDLTDKITEMVLQLIGRIPPTDQRASSTPHRTARDLADAAKVKAAATAGTLALPPGPLGWATIVPEILAVWNIQKKMVTDIAAAFDKEATLSQEQMIYCLFKHTAAQAVRDVVVRVGERYLVRHSSLRVMQNLARKIGLRVTQRAVSKGVSRWIPFVSAVGVGSYAYYDTHRVAQTAIELFSSEVHLEDSAENLTQKTELKQQPATHCTLEKNEEIPPSS